MIILLRAATFGAALFLCVVVRAKPQVVPHQETSKDAIDRAFALCLQKERSQAITMLQNAIRVEKKSDRKKSSKALGELQEALNKVSTMFLSEKAQQLYELGVSLRSTAPPTALQKLTEADRIDNGNLNIGLEIVRVMIINGDCGGANAEAKKIKTIMSDVELVDLALAQTEICLVQLENFRSIKSLRSPNSDALSRYWLELDVEVAYKAGNFEQGKQTLQALERLDPQYPETFYWSWRISSEQGQTNESAATKYLNLCKSISTKSLRNYLPDPWLCRRVSEVETFIKKTNNSVQ